MHKSFQFMDQFIITNKTTIINLEFGSPIHHLIKPSSKSKSEIDENK